MGTYAGSVVLRSGEGEIGVAQVSLARTDLIEGGWRGYAYDIDLTAQDGEEVTLELPHGTSGRARVVIDLTGPQPVTRLVGVEGDPV